MDGLPSLPSSFTFGPAFFLSLFFGLIGGVYFMYGKKQEKFPLMFIGIGMGVYPYFVKGAFLTLVIGLALMALPFILKE